MKQMLLVAVVAAVVSSLLTLLVASALRAPGGSAPASGLTASEFKAALGDLEREVAGLREALRERSVSETHASTPPPPVAPAGSASGSGAVPGADPAAPMVRRGPPESTRAGASLLEKLREIAPRLPEGGKDYEARGEVLKRWMFRPESEVFDWFGLPTRIDASGVEERWVYEIPTGEHDSEGSPKIKGYWVLVNKGRVVDLGD